jgi:hypothetical protein
MKRFLSTAAALASFAIASAGIATLEAQCASPAIVASAPEHSNAACKLAMGPTSAPQKPGGVGQEPSQTPQRQKPKQKNNAS